LNGRLRSAAAVLAGLALFACSSRPAPENVLRVNVGAEVQDLDPHIVSGVPEHQVLSALFDGLTDLDPETMEPVPAIAERWEVSDDRRVYTFYLREDAKWSNGDPVTAADFAYSWERILTPSLASEYAYLLFCIENAQEFNEGLVEDFDEVGVEVVDERTLKVTLGAPTPYFLALHYHQSFYPVHRSTIEAHGEMAERGTRWTRAENHVSNGPFRITEWRPAEYIRAVKNEHYWDADSVRMEGIQFFPISDALTEVRAFETGQLDMTHTMPLDKIAVYREEQPELLMVNPYLGVYFYRLNVTRPPLDDVRVRQALSLALDRERLARDVLKAGEPPAFHFTPPDTAGYTPEARVDYDPERARQLLAEAGFPGGEGFPQVDLLYNTSEQHKTIGEAVQQMWKEELGIGIGLYNQDWKVYLSSTNQLDYDIARAAWIGDVVDPINFLELFTSWSGNNRTGWESETYDALLSQAYATPETEMRHLVLGVAEKELLEQLPVIPVYFYTTKYLKAERVKGFVPNILDYHKWKDLWLEGYGGDS